MQVDAVVRASYPDGAHDAEALLAAPDGTLYIVTKGDTGEVALYRVPREAERQCGAASRAHRRAADQRHAGRRCPHHRWRDVTRRPMGGAADRTALMFYPAADFLKGNFREAGAST